MWINRNKYKSLLIELCNNHATIDNLRQSQMDGMKRWEVSMNQVNDRLKAIDSTLDKLREDINLHICIEANKND